MDSFLSGTPVICWYRLMHSLGVDGGLRYDLMTAVNEINQKTERCKKKQ